MPPNFSFTSAVATPRSGCSIVYIFLIPARALLMLGLCLGVTDGSHGSILSRGVREHHFKTDPAGHVVLFLFSALLKGPLSTWNLVN